MYANINISERSSTVFLHIGGEYSISVHLIIGIFDFDAVTQSGSETIRFLKEAELREKIEHVSPDLPRSFILTLERVYLSPISAQTLRQRLKGRDIFALNDDYTDTEMALKGAMANGS